MLKKKSVEGLIPTPRPFVFIGSANIHWETNPYQIFLLILLIVLFHLRVIYYVTDTVLSVYLIQSSQ